MEKTITNNEILFTCKLDLPGGGSLSLHKQSYSDGTCFYTLQDRFGFYKIEYASRYISDLIKQVTREIEIGARATKKPYNKSNAAVQEIHNAVQAWMKEVLRNLEERREESRCQYAHTC